MKMRLVLFLILTGMGMQVRATSLGLDLSQGNETQSAEISAYGDFNDPNDNFDLSEINYDWDLALTRTISDVKESSGASIKDTTTDVVVGAGLQTPSNWRFGLDLNYSSTPEENLRSLGPSILLGKKFHYGRNGSSDFRPYFDLSYIYQNLDYTQTFDTTATRANGQTRPVTGRNTIDQQSSQFLFKWKPLDWFRFKTAFTKYSYNRNVNDFLQYLDTHAVVGGLSSGFSNALSGFYDHSFLVGVSFYPGEQWQLDISHSVSRVLADDSDTTTDKGMLYRDLTAAWRAGVGGSASKSSNPAVTSNSAVMVSLSSEF